MSRDSSYVVICKIKLVKPSKDKNHAVIYEMLFSLPSLFLEIIETVLFPCKILWNTSLNGATTAFNL